MFPLQEMQSFSRQNSGNTINSRLCRPDCGRASSFFFFSLNKLRWSELVLGEFQQTSWKVHRVVAIFSHRVKNVKLCYLKIRKWSYVKSLQQWKHVHCKEHRYNHVDECEPHYLFLGFPSSTIEDLEPNYRDAALRAGGFRNFSSSIGLSDHLTRKSVAPYGIRFRNNEYWKVAIVPMRDIAGHLWSCQYLNPDGSKKRMSELFALTGLVKFSVIDRWLPFPYCGTSCQSYCHRP